MAEVEVKNKKNDKSKLSSALKKANNGFVNFIRNLKKVKLNSNVKYGIGILVGIALILLIFDIIFKDKNVNYPIVFNTSEGDMYLLDSKSKKEADAIKLAVGESVSNVLYANNSDRYILFKKGNDLYLFDKKDESETVKLIENVKTYYFSDDDKYIVILDNNDNLNVYNYKNCTKIESDVSEILGVTEDKVLFEKDSVIYVRSINPKKDDREKITAEYGYYMQFSENGKNIVYINKENNLMVYNVSKKKDNKIATNIKNYYCDNESCDRMFYVESGDVRVVHYYDGKKSTKVADGIYAVLATDLEHKQIVYSTVNDGKYTIYYHTVGKKAIKVEDNLTAIRTLKIFDGKELYYITGKNEVKYVKISGDKVSKPKSLGTGVTGFLYQYNDGFAFVSDVDSKSNGTLFLARNGKAKKIDNSVNSSLITVNKDGNKIYYFKDYDVVGSLYVTSGSKNKKIDENVYTFSYINDDLLYYIKDYSGDKGRGDLFIYNKRKGTRVKEGVSRIANSPIKYKVK
ncbi:MAG TPA: hypothetical protein DCE23_00900 [Firmicutes bacterium]|nr:hypothetical protein [Bacillota bacterium]